MYDDDYGRGLRDGAKHSFLIYQSIEERKRREKQLREWKKEIGAMDWNAIGSERLRRIKASKYEEMYSRTYSMGKVYASIGILLGIYLFFRYISHFL